MTKNTILFVAGAGDSIEVGSIHWTKEAMKNNRTGLTAEQTQTIIRRLGEPRSLATFFRDALNLGRMSIVMLDLSESSHVALYEALHNEKDKYEVVQEDDYTSRSSVFTVIRYLRKTACEPMKVPPVSSKLSLKKSAKSQKPKTKVVGFKPKLLAKKQKAKPPGPSQPS
jgi:hypothetical protein